MTASGPSWDDPSDDDELIRLRDAADQAYRRVRREVIDRLPPGTHRDESQLSEAQRAALWHLFDAEADLAAFREQRA